VRDEEAIARVFGLVHGLAFSGLLDVAANPFSSIENATVDHLGLIGTVLAAAAGVTWFVTAARRVVGTPEGLY
jgi:hypothetical protein